MRRRRGPFQSASTTESYQRPRVTQPMSHQGAAPDGPGSESDLYDYLVNQRFATVTLVDCKVNSDSK